MRTLSSTLIATAICLAPLSAHAGWWTYDADANEGPIIPRIRFGSYVGIWSAEFDRPARACRDNFETTIPIPRAGGGVLNQNQGEVDPGFFSCANDNSDELGVSAGVGVSFRVLGPIHLNAAVEAVFTIPERDFALKNQVFVAMPITLGLTFPNWVVRPIASAGLMPLLYITDDSRDYALTSELGFAVRMSSWGDLSLTVAYEGADTAEGVVVRLAISPL